MTDLEVELGSGIYLFESVFHSFPPTVRGVMMVPVCDDDDDDTTKMMTGAVMMNAIPDDGRVWWWQWR